MFRGFDSSDDNDSFSLVAVVRFRFLLFLLSLRACSSSLRRTCLSSLFLALEYRGFFFPVVIVSCLGRGNEWKERDGSLCSFFSVKVREFEQKLNFDDVSG